MNSAWRSINGVRNAVITEGALVKRERSLVSTRYLKKTPACPELPRRTRRTGGRSQSRFAVRCRASRRLRTIWRQHPRFPDFARHRGCRHAQPLRLACAPRSLDAVTIPGELGKHAPKLPSQFFRWSRINSVDTQRQKTCRLMSPSACSSQRARARDHSARFAPPWPRRAASAWHWSAACSPSAAVNPATSLTLRTGSSRKPSVAVPCRHPREPAITRGMM